LAAIYDSPFGYAEFRLPTIYCFTYRVYSNCNVKKMDWPAPWHWRSLSTSTCRNQFCLHNLPFPWSNVVLVYVRRHQKYQVSQSALLQYRDQGDWLSSSRNVCMVGCDLWFPSRGRGWEPYTSSASCLQCKKLIGMHIMTVHHSPHTWGNSSLNWRR
jgi:hypothetical protein